MVDASPVDFSLRRMFGDPLKCRGLTPIWFRNAEARLLAVFRKVLATIPRRSAPGVPFGGPVEVEKGPDKDVPFVVGWQSDEGLSDVPAVATVITPPAPGSVVRLIAAFLSAVKYDSATSSTCVAQDFISPGSCEIAKLVGTCEGYV